MNPGILALNFYRRLAIKSRNPGSKERPEDSITCEGTPPPLAVVIDLRDSATSSRESPLFAQFFVRIVSQVFGSVINKADETGLMSFAIDWRV